MGIAVCRALVDSADANTRRRACGKDTGHPQGGVISPLLANLFLHYAFDSWVSRNLRSVRFCRYADDGVIHCRSLRQAKLVFEKIGERFRQCGLELHPDKTRIVYCKDVNRQEDYPCVKFTFLGYTFQPRKAVDEYAEKEETPKSQRPSQQLNTRWRPLNSSGLKIHFRLRQNKYSRVYVNFSPPVSREALKALRQTIRGWHLQLECDKNLTDLSAMFNPRLRGWYQYYGRFYKSAMSAVWKHLNDYLVRGLMRKYKRLARHKTGIKQALGRLAVKFQNAFVHWELGCAPKAG